MALKGLVAGTEGNLSARDRDGTILVTPSGVNKGEIEPEMLVRLDLDAKIIEGELEPTSEKFMHLEFYRQRPGVGGVALGHPIFCTAFAAAHQALPENILPELIATIGQYPSSPTAGRRQPSSPLHSLPIVASITSSSFRITAQQRWEKTSAKLTIGWKSWKPMQKPFGPQQPSAE
jgi:L-fuculose-phosphate aldolase